MKNACIKSIIDLGANDERIVFITVDQFTGFDEELKDALKERFFFESISEANVVGMASGLASDGYVPYIFNHAVFNTRRCYEQIALDACLQNRPIRLIGMGAGLATAHLGPTHTSIEDVSLMRSIPGMTVLVPCDANEIVTLMPQTVDWPESIYIRLGKYGQPKYGKTIDKKITAKSRIGKAAIISDTGAKKQNDVLLVSNGALTPIALEVSSILSAYKLKCLVLHIATVKPIDKETLLQAVLKSQNVFTLEEHSLIGGLGSACLETLIDTIEPEKLPPIHRVGLADRFIHEYGNQRSLFELYGLMPDQIVDTIKNNIKIN